MRRKNLVIRICVLGLYSKVICVTSRYFALFLDYNVGARACTRVHAGAGGLGVRDDRLGRTQRLRL